MKKENSKLDLTAAIEEHKTNFVTTGKLNASTENNITFCTVNEWLLKINPNGTIVFNENVKLNADEFAKEFIDIIEKNTASKSKKIMEIVMSNDYKDTEYKRFGKEEDRDWIKARLFDDICKLF